jgi:hypothetical protein
MKAGWQIVKQLLVYEEQKVLRKFQETFVCARELTKPQYYVYCGEKTPKSSKTPWVEKFSYRSTVGLIYGLYLIS